MLNLKQALGLPDLNKAFDTYSLDFNGTDESVTIDALVGILNPLEGSVSVWCKLDTTSSNGTLFRTRVDGQNYIALLYHASTNQMRFEFKAGGTLKQAKFSDAIENIDKLDNESCYNITFDKFKDETVRNKYVDYFKFVFVRNPFDRCVSAFSHIVMESVLQDHYNVWPVIHPGKKYDRSELRLEFDAIYKLWTLFAKRTLYDYDINGESVHWMPQNVLVECDGEVFVDFIGKYENLENDWKKISNKLKVSDVLPRVPVAQTERQNPNTDRAQRQNLHWSQFYVDLELIDSCAEFFFRDLELFEYKDKIIELTQRAFVIREELQKQRDERGTKLEQNLRIDIDKDK